VKALDKLRIQRKIAPPAPGQALLWLERLYDTERDLNRAWKARYSGPAADCIVDLANLDDTPTAIKRFRELLPQHYDIASETVPGFSDKDEEKSRQQANVELIVLRDQLRDFWNEVTRVGQVLPDAAKVSQILHGWQTFYPFNPEGVSDGWQIFWGVGSVFPLQHNFRGAIIRVLFDKRRYLAMCPSCGRYFIKARNDQKNCLSDSCLRKANRERQQDFQERHARKHPGRKSRKRTS